MSSNKLKRSLPVSRQQKISVLVILVLALGIGFGVSYTVAQKSKPIPKAGDTASSAGRLADKDGKAVYEVQLKKVNKEPIDLVLKTGDYVQFNSKDDGEHQIIQGLATNTEHGESSPGQNEHAEANGSRPEKTKALDSGVIKADEGFLLQFNTQGKYEFHDNYDHDYTITVIVYDPNGKTKIE